jgi:redox-sensitive bicupin YhaK (pirin superfamily)
MTPHRIRLRGFWTVTPLPDGRVRHARRFGRPTRIDAGDGIWLTGEAAPGRGPSS